MPADHVRGTQRRTVQQDLPGVWVRAAVPDVAAGSVTVHLSKAATVSAAVAWFVIN